MNTKTFSPVTTKIKFVKEFREDQFTCIKKAIARHFNQRGILRYSTSGPETSVRIYNSFNQIDNILGTAYTSTGMYAGLWICNVSAWFDEDNIYKYEGFVIGTNHKFYALLQDKDENELVIEL